MTGDTVASVNHYSLLAPLSIVCTSCIVCTSPLGNDAGRSTFLKSIISGVDTVIISGHALLNTARRPVMVQLTSTGWTTRACWESLNQCCFNVGPLSATLAQHRVFTIGQLFYILSCGSKGQYLHAL